MSNSIAARMDFENAVRIFDNAFNPNHRQDVDVVSLFRLTQSELRLEQPLVTTSTQYLFPVLVNINNQATTAFNTEVRLNLQDSFVPTHVGIFLAKPTSSTDTAFALESYPNPFIFTNSQQMYALYNGQMQIVINNNRYTQNWDLWRHYKANQTQQTAAPGAGSPLDQLDGSEDGFYPMQPYVLLLGSQNIELTIKVPVAPTAVDANSRFVIKFRGILAQNSTVVN